MGSTPPKCPDSVPFAPLSPAARSTCHQRVACGHLWRWEAKQEGASVQMPLRTGTRTSVPRAPSCRTAHGRCRSSAIHNSPARCRRPVPLAARPAGPSPRGARLRPRRPRPITRRPRPIRSARTPAPRPRRRGRPRAADEPCEARPFSGRPAGRRQGECGLFEFLYCNPKPNLQLQLTQLKDLLPKHGNPADKKPVAKNEAFGKQEENDWWDTYTVRPSGSAKQRFRHRHQRCYPSVCLLTLLRRAPP